VDVNRDAPVVAATDLVIAASPDTVWDVITDIERWPSWNPDVRSMSFSGDVEEGAQFRWKAGPATISSTIRRIERPRLIGWIGQTLGIDAMHVYRLEPRDGKTLVTTEESYDGLLARVFRGPVEKMLKKSLDAGLGHLKAEAERREREPERKEP
jgi:uncharacterized protein YndB with AHSA1/START domain